MKNNQHFFMSEYSTVANFATVQNKETNQL